MFAFINIEAHWAACLRIVPVFERGLSCKALESRRPVERGRVIRTWSLEDRISVSDLLFGKAATLIKSEFRMHKSFKSLF